MLTFNRVEFAYPKTTPYHFDFRVNRGEIVGIAGASGSGKSTLLDLVAGFQTPSSGQIELDDNSLLRLAPEERPVSILFQKDNVFAHLTAAQNVQLGRKDYINTSEKLAEVGLAGFENQKCASLSGGQQQRVALARTLARNQPILLLDEPFSALDGDTASQMRDLVKNLVKQHNWHAILVSHHSQDFDALADQLFNLKDGRLEAVVR
ncbi:ATP-binding cassette domain-containing protein [Maritalea porphyrae]|jgi:thiamine transport system ATP-binding protein|uniref:ATP-binding cassette domain-containing protein n=1 Tax=Maritalea porphyrae TaxID=880732 RepID=UPI0022AF526F|nr:ATP-binding cassette domain-containing protein [Maritalea porphyrae]MCZ4273651.1 ATP-binding cassette domain-containing protein [Maritalea porphyrae]